MIEYKLVKDYRPVRTFLRNHGVDVPLHFPTVAAYEDGKVVGVLSTRGLGKHGIWLGPYVVPDRPLVAYRLLCAMDNLLLACGITLYFFAIAPDNPLLPQARKSGLFEEFPEPDDNGDFLFKRRVT